MYATGTGNAYTRGYTTFTNNNIARGTSISISEMPILAIAPKTSAWVDEYSIVNSIFLDCDLKELCEGADKHSEYAYR